MNFKDLKVGAIVKVSSTCGVEGCTGTIQRYNSSSDVYVLLDNLPFYYNGHNPVRLSSKSLELLVEKETSKSESTSDALRIGVFYAVDFADDFESDGYFSTTEGVLIVRAKSKEACMKILADLIAEGDANDEEYDSLVFDNQKYRIKTQFCVVIDDELFKGKG
jgi:hypothetical protein